MTKYSSGAKKGFHTFVLQMTELNTLKMKAPSDLWKEDLAAFTEELEVNMIYDDDINLFFAFGGSFI